MLLAAELEADELEDDELEADELEDADDCEADDELDALLLPPQATRPRHMASMPTTTMATILFLCMFNSLIPPTIKTAFCFIGFFAITHKGGSRMSPPKPDINPAPFCMMADNGTVMEGKRRSHVAEESHRCRSHRVFAAFWI